MVQAAAVGYARLMDTDEAFIADLERRAEDPAAQFSGEDVARLCMLVGLDKAAAVAAGQSERQYDPTVILGFCQQVRAIWAGQTRQIEDPRGARH